MKMFDLDEYIVAPSGKIAKRVIYHDSNVVAFILNIGQGAVLPNHTHFECTVLLHILKGRGTVIINGQKTDVKVQDLIQVEGQETMGLENTGEEPLVVYVTISPLPPNEKYYVDADM